MNHGPEGHATLPESSVTKHKEGFTILREQHTLWAPEGTLGLEPAVVLLQNMAFWPLVVLASALYIPAASVFVTVSGLLGSRRATMRRLRRAISWYGWVVLRCAWPFVRIAYRDLAPQERDPPYIFVCNHRSASDPFLMACLPFECIQIANVWPLRLPLLGLIAGLAGYVSVNEMPLDEFYEEAERLLGRGVCLISFPEGTRSGSRRMGPFGSSVFRLALRCRAVIVPVAIAGNEAIPHKGSLVLHPGRIRVEKLPALRWEQYREMNPYQLKSCVQERLQAHLDRIEGEAP